MSPIKQFARKTIGILQSAKATLQRSNRPPPSETVDTDSGLLAVPTDTNTTKTPRRSKRASKPRYSQIATPYVPGHLVADESVYPPVQPRLHPAERSADDVSAFQEAMDRAQAAFYEVSSPPIASRVEDDDDRAISGYSREANDLSLPAQQRARTRRQNGRIDGTMQHSNSQQELHGQLSSSLRNSVSRQEISVNGSSEKALGKRRQDANATLDNAEATASSPEKILKTGSFESSRNATATSHSKSRSNANGKPALRQTRQGTSRLPQRPLMSASDEAVSSAAISSAAQTARQRALLERTYAKGGGKIT